MKSNYPFGSKTPTSLDSGQGTQLDENTTTPDSHSLGVGAIKTHWHRWVLQTPLESLLANSTCEREGRAKECNGDLCKHKCLLVIHTQHLLPWMTSSTWSVVRNHTHDVTWQPMAQPRSLLSACPGSTWLEEERVGSLHHASTPPSIPTLDTADA